MSTETKSRKWLIEGGPTAVGADEGAQLTARIYEIVSLLSTVGGAVKIATEEGNLVVAAGRERAEGPVPDLFVTEYFVAEWFPSVPAIRRSQPEPEPEPEVAVESELAQDPELEPVEG